MEQSAEHTKAVHSSPWKSSVSKRVVPELDFVFLFFFVIVCFDFLHFIAFATFCFLGSVLWKRDFNYRERTGQIRIK